MAVSFSNPYAGAVEPGAQRRPYADADWCRDEGFAVDIRVGFPVVESQHLEGGGFTLSLADVNGLYSTISAGTDAMQTGSNTTLFRLLSLSTACRRMSSVNVRALEQRTGKHKRKITRIRDAGNRWRNTFRTLFPIGDRYLCKSNMAFGGNHCGKQAIKTRLSGSRMGYN